MAGSIRGFAGQPIILDDLTDLIEHASPAERQRFMDVWMELPSPGIWNPLIRASNEWPSIQEAVTARRLKELEIP